ncbi:MAG: hypothetical protein FVQ83_14575 [Chloroflexi bacterium]|nr:hypothetical protein [Chloroflexota bacterium]
MHSNPGDHGSQKHLEIWDDLAELVNQLPQDERKRYRKNLGKFMHDLRNTLALITNSEDLIRRDFRERDDVDSVMELMNIVKTATHRASGHLTDIIESFGDQINLSEDD